MCFYSTKIYLMSNKIIYWPHKDRESPLPYIRIKEETTQGAKNNLLEVFNSHEDIKQTLKLWFDIVNPNSAFSQLLEKFDLHEDTQIHISMLNYGNTELIYLVKFAWKWEVVVCINQPHIPPSKIKQEYENLKRLYSIDSSHIVNPLAYFSVDKWYSFYVTEYIKDAICIAHNPAWIAWFYNPLPYYHFENIDLKTSTQLNKNIIALLVNYYDKENWIWISDTEISWNDFLLNKDFDPKNLQTIQDSIKLISARNNIKISFDEYLNLIRREFLIWTNRDMDDVVNWKIRINHKSINPMTAEEIEEWIKLWLDIKNQNIK